MLFLCLCIYSIGSSNVIMCFSLFVFIISIKLAKVVLLPLPVAPVTNINPLYFSANVDIISGSPNVSNLGTIESIILIAIAYFPFVYIY